ncbi:putative protein kinase CMGC-DYRK-YAK family [Helianthus annuus]|nr:putative protein kinase CMGC-DYRK-YAK family [Helianthus annuus]
MDEVNTVVVADERLVSASRSVRWSPKQLGFQPYAAPVVGSGDARTRNSSGFVKRPLVSRLTKDIVETYRICNPQFNYLEELNPKRFLTSPSAGVLNDGFDNENSDFILSVNCSLVNPETHRRYIVKDMLGQGTFGQVAKCWVAELDRFVAVKVIKNQPAYYQQALVEVSILTTLNKKFDPEDKNHIVRIYDYFVYQRHLCIAFELLDSNLYELLKLNKFRGLSLSIVQLFSKQILYGLALMKDAAIIHCDLKPENILLCTSTRTRSDPPEVKIIDFGSACMEDHTVYSYIQSRYYRSPEVVLGYRYTTAIDMWSFGCIVAELFLGLPLFPGASEFDLLKRMIKIIGEQPPDYVLKEAKNTSKFFKCVGTVNHEDGSQASSSGRSIYQALSEEEYEDREMKKPPIGKEYFSHMNLEGIVTKYPYKKELKKEEVFRESQMRLSLIDFLKGLVEFDPAKRWSPLQASKHPFVTGEPFTCPYKPAPETPRVPVSHNVKVDHHPAGGHWFAAGLSPNVLGGNRVAMYNNSHFQVMPPYAHGNNFGSLGSHGSYNDGTGLGSSYGSYGDNSNMLAYYSPGSIGSGKPLLHPKSAVHDKPESSSSLPDPGDWDPNYSDELLLQDDSSELNNMTMEFSKSMQISQGFTPTESFVGVGRFNQMSNSNMSIQRPNGPIQAFPHADGSPDVYVHPMMHSSHLTPHFSQFAPSRLGQQQRFSHGRSMGARGGEWNHVKVQPPLSNYSSVGQRSPGSNNNAPWGRRGNHPMATNILPSSHGGNEYGRIA